jgi:hypothetical protein
MPRPFTPIFARSCGRALLRKPIEILPGSLGKKPRHDWLRDGHPKTGPNSPRSSSGRWDGFVACRAEISCLTIPSQKFDLKLGNSRRTRNGTSPNLESIALCGCSRFPLRETASVPSAAESCKFAQLVPSRLSSHRRRGWFRCAINPNSIV